MIAKPNINLNALGFGFDSQATSCAFLESLRTSECRHTAAPPVCSPHRLSSPRQLAFSLPRRSTSPLSARSFLSSISLPLRWMQPISFRLPAVARLRCSRSIPLMDCPLPEHLERFSILLSVAKQTPRAAGSFPPASMVLSPRAAGLRLQPTLLHNSHKKKTTHAVSSALQVRTKRSSRGGLADERKLSWTKLMQAFGGRGWNRTTNLSIKSRRVLICPHLRSPNISCFFIDIMARLPIVRLPSRDTTYHSKGAQKGGTKSCLLCL